ncbi:MAG: 3-hydroxyacyl-CoA dehydrogenase family protein [Alphaproteobacteria bacterium]|nr:3-hydroxyacyl-CoA dehydrogenase family protein [Rhodospirillales bacterium]MCW9045562.1 3-hydroxyacyl-CoA dehydrogenase family protein [Alphaproteobacteria bacterium]
MTVKKVGVVGAGMMGAEIAFTFALAGHPVLLNDTSEDSLSTAMDRLKSILDKGVEKNRYSEEQRENTLANLRTTTDLKTFSDRDFIIEAVFENKDVKGSIYTKLDNICKDECIIASNTSTLPITVLASFVKPERRPYFLGTHFFSPVSRMKLVEVIPALETSEEIFEEVMGLCRNAEKEPIRVKDVAGFAVNRLLHAFFIEAVRLVEEEVATPEDIDIACRLGLGHPVGPFDLMDIVTNNLSLQVQEILHDAYGPRFLPRPRMKQMVEAGYNGRKAGKGWRVK